MLSRPFNDKISHRQIVWMLLYQLGHQPHFIISSTWTLISQTWPQWKMRCLPQHGCVHQPAQQSFVICPGSEWAPYKCEPVNSPAAQNKSIERQGLRYPLLETLCYCGFSAFCLTSYRMLMGSWPCRSFRRAQKRTPLLFRHSHFMMGLCKGERWVEF